MAEVHQGSLFGPEKVGRTTRGNAFRPRARRVRIVNVIPNQQQFDLESFQMNSMSMNLGTEGFFFNLGPVLVAGPGPTGRTMSHSGNINEFFEEAS